MLNRRTCLYRVALTLVVPLTACGGGGGEPNSSDGNLVLSFGYPGVTGNDGLYPRIWSTVRVLPNIQSLGNNRPHFRISAGRLPAGLSLNSDTGEISGLAQETGVFDCNIELTVEGFSGSLTAPLYFQVNAHVFGYFADVLTAGATVSIGPFHSELPPGAVLRYEQTSSSLVPGLSLDTETGFLNGTLTRTDMGQFEFGVRCTMTYGTQTQVFEAVAATVHIEPLLIGFDYPEFFVYNAAPGVPVLIRPSSNSLSGYQWSFRVKPGERLPDGFVIDSETGVVSGTISTLPVLATVTLQLLLAKGPSNWVVERPLVFRLQAY